MIMANVDISFKTKDRGELQPALSIFNPPKT